MRQAAVSCAFRHIQEEVSVSYTTQRKMIEVICTGVRVWKFCHSYYVADSIPLDFLHDDFILYEQVESFCICICFIMILTQGHG